MESNPQGQAAKLFQSSQFEEAAEAYTKCLKLLAASPQDNHNNARIALLFNRAMCNFKLKKFEKTIEDYDRVLSIDSKNIKALSKKTKALSKCGKFVEALEAAKEWKELDQENEQVNEEIKMLDYVVGKLLNPENDDDEVELALGDMQPSEWTSSKEADVCLQNGTAPSTAKLPVDDAVKPESITCDDKAEDIFHCTYCGIKFATQMELKTHCRSDLHKKKIVSDDGKSWKYRDPPRGLTSEEYTKCPRYFGEGTCRFGSKCSQAHSDEELTEWKERFEYKRQQLQKAKESELHGNSYAEQLMEKWMSAEAPETVMSENVPGVKVYVNSDLSITMSSKRSSHAWIFTLTSRLHMQRVALLDESAHRHFHISSITIGPKKNQRTQKLEDHCQEWTNTNPPNTNTKNETVYRIKASFRTDIYGTFRQTVVFDFSCEPVLCQNLCVDSNAISDFDKLSEELVITESGRWDFRLKSIQKFEPAPLFPDPNDENLMQKYPIPSANQIAKSKSLHSNTANSENYRQRMHDLLAIEEMAQFSSIAKYNVKTVLHLTNRYLLMPSTVSTAKYSVNGELFAQLDLSLELSEDTAHGRLILQNVNSVLMAPYDHKSTVDREPSVVYEALVEDRGKTFIFLKLSSQCVTELELKADTDFHAQVQFQLNRCPNCELHLAVDRLPDTARVFPDVSLIPNIPWTPQKQWSDNLDSRLNAKQKEAVVAITTVLSFKLPPVLLIGPYGTGKTFTLAQAALQILRQPNTRILICTHSNSAADLYIKDYFHPHVEGGYEEARPLRIVYKYRWMNTVSSLIQNYCLIEQDGHGSRFKVPTKEDVERYRIVITTLSTSRTLYDLGLEAGFFTHILIDEAAQAIECETIMPLALAGENTRVVLAGDHMQMSPEVYSDFARQHGFHVSLLERLFDIYPGDNPCKILLCENYRSHKAIIDFTSELFYEKKLIASGTQPVHDTYHPLTFFTARGEDVQHQNSTGFYNNSEVYEIAERVSELQKTWPKAWGAFDENSIGVVSPYVDQVARIRSELRKRKMHRVCVERVFNVQGKQFRVIILSTVRTRRTCGMENNMDDVDFGFLSNVKLLNTAITRAQSLVAVVGDPVSLCTIGKCRKVWETFLEICHNNSSIYGMTWSQLRAQMDGVELKKTYVLNPLAPEFIPNRLRHGSSPQAPIGYGPYGYVYAPTASHLLKQQGVPYPNVHASFMPSFMPQLPMYQPLPYYGMTQLIPRLVPCLPPYPPPLPPPQPQVQPPQPLHPPKVMQGRPVGMAASDTATNTSASAITTPTNYTVVSVSHHTNTSETEPTQASRTQVKGNSGIKSARETKAAASMNSHKVASSSNIVHPQRPVVMPPYQNQSVPSHSYQGIPVMPVQPNAWPDLPGSSSHQLMQPTQMHNHPQISKNKNLIHEHRQDPNKLARYQPVNSSLNHKKNDETVLVDSPYLQREMYHYILKKDGAEEASKFMENLQGPSKGPQSYEGPPLFKHSNKMCNVLKEVSLKEGMPIVQSGPGRHVQSKQKNKSPVRTLYKKDGTVTVSVGQVDPSQRSRHSSQSSGEGDMSSGQFSCSKDGPRYSFDLSPPKENARYQNAFAPFGSSQEYRPVESNNNIGSNQSFTVRKPPEMIKTTSATVNVSNFLEPEKLVMRQSQPEEQLSGFIDPSPPAAVDQVFRFIESMDELDSDVEQSRYFPRKKVGSSGNLTTAGAVPTYANVLRGDGAKTPGRMRHVSAPQSLYSGGSNNVFGPSGITTPHGPSSQHSSGSLFDSTSNLAIDLNTDYYNRMDRFDLPSQHSRSNLVEEESHLQVVKNFTSLYDPFK